MGEVTISTAWAWFLAGCIALSSIAKAWEIVKQWGKGDIKEQMRLINSRLDNDNKRIKALEDSNAVTMRALLALIRHSIDGNNIDGLKKTQNEIQDYLIKR